MTRLRLPPFRVEIRECDRIPAGYGLAWWRNEVRQAVCFPVPFNIVLALLRRAWHWFVAGVRPSVLDEQWRNGNAYGRAEIQRVLFKEEVEAILATAYERSDAKIRNFIDIGIAGIKKDVERVKERIGVNTD